MTLFAHGNTCVRNVTADVLSDAIITLRATFEFASIKNIQLDSVFYLLKSSIQFIPNVIYKLKNA